MNLKYYLRGLGLGLIVTALVLGIHNSRTRGADLSDDQIKERAAKLGMVDGSTRLIEEIPSTEEMLADIEENNVTEVTSEQDTATTETADDVIADADALLEDSGTETAADAAEDPGSEITTDAPDDPVLDYPTEDDSFTMLEPETITEVPVSETDSGTDHEFTPAAGASDSVSSAGGAGSITISSGDSSDRVARKLADAGIVSSAAEYDRFLCTHGYDRILRTGTYTFNAGMSDDEIARMITGR